MKISASAVGMEYSHSRIIESITKESRQLRTARLTTDQVSISAQARQKYLHHMTQQFSASSQVNRSTSSNHSNPTIQFLTEVTNSMGMFQTNANSFEWKRSGTPSDNNQTLSEINIVKINKYQFVQIDENSQFASTGIIETEDGKQIAFSLSLHLQRLQVFESSRQSTIIHQLTDPLVINFGAESVSLNDTFFTFDLNGDGSKEEIAKLGAGSGYLALDRNDNGVIDDGLELFGPKTGQGFSELAQYDNDNNLWIDENDPIYHDLKLWVQDDSDEGTLKSLSEIGVGAIYLGHSNDDFNLVSNQGVLLGNIKGSGIILMESGEVKTIQEIDLASQQRVPVNNTNATIERSGTEINIGSNQIVPNSLVSIQNIDDNGEEINNEQGINDENTATLLFSDQAKNIIEKLQKLRDEQKAYNQQIMDQRKESKSIVEQLVDKLEEQSKALREDEKKERSA